MNAAESYLKTQRVAQSLGVSVSTIKRWVDSGMIRAARTVGKHRLIPKSEALRLAREKGFSLDKIEALSSLGSSHGQRISDQVRASLQSALIDGRVRETRALIETLYSSGVSAVALADDLIGPVMRHIGHQWLVGQVDIYQEHRATQMIAASLMDLIHRVGDAQTASQPLALVANCEGDPYILPGLLCELALLESGWRVQNLGVNLPLRSLANATIHSWPRLICISVSYVSDVERFAAEYEAFHEAAAATNAAVILGGAALTPELRSKLVFATFGERMSHLAEFARLIVPKGSPTSPEAETSNGGDSANLTAVAPR
jgi:excisionase family DNA binding protein